MSTLDDLRKLRDRFDALQIGDKYIDVLANPKPLLNYAIRLAEAAETVNHTGGDDLGTIIWLEFVRNAPIEGLE